MAHQVTLIDHGELEASRALKFRIETELGWNNVQIPKMEESINLDYKHTLIDIN